MSDLDLATAVAQLLRQWSQAGISHVPRGISDWLRTAAPDQAPGARHAEAATAITRKPKPIEPLGEVPHVPPSVPIAAKSPPELPTQRAPAPSTWEGPLLSQEARAGVLSDLAAQVAGCARCSDLSCFRKQTVFGSGNLRPRVVFFGEAPGADEDRAGLPFVGRAGELLTKIIQACKLKREDVYILNAIKCRPPGNRAPTDEELENCREYFERQLDVLRPEYLVLLGATAVRAVLKDTTPVGRLRGRWYAYHGAKVLITYHPAYLLRNESAKRLTWEDMQMLIAALGL
jgi:DNA polymerase